MPDETPTATPAPADAPTDAAPITGLVDWDDPNFQPEVTSYSGGDHIKFFRMGKDWPNRPFEDRKFQLGGKERVAILDPKVVVFWGHRLNKNFMGSAVNGTRRCVKQERGHCVLCDHYESAPEEEKNGRKVKKARCGRRAQVFGINLLVYKTDLEGKLFTSYNGEMRFIHLNPEKGPVICDAAGNPTDTPAELEYDVYLWRFSAGKFQDIKDLRQEWDLKQHDVIFSLDMAKEENFQDFSQTPSPRAAWRLAEKARPGASKEIVQYLKDNRYDIMSILGKEYTDEEMLGFLGTGQPTQGGAVATPSVQTPGGPPAAPIGDVASEIEAEIAGIAAGTAQPPAAPAEQPPTPPAQPANTTGATPPATPAPTEGTTPPAAVPPETPVEKPAETPPSEPAPAADTDFDALLS